MTAEKIAPSPIDLVALLQQAVDSERKTLRNGNKAPLKDVLGKCIAEYNRMVSVKRHRIDSSRRALVYNLLLGYPWFDYLHLNLFSDFAKAFGAANLDLTRLLFANQHTG